MRSSLPEYEWKWFEWPTWVGRGKKKNMNCAVMQYVGVLIVLSYRTNTIETKPHTLTHTHMKQKQKINKTTTGNKCAKHVLQSTRQGNKDQWILCVCVVFNRAAIPSYCLHDTRVRVCVRNRDYGEQLISITRIRVDVEIVEIYLIIRIHVILTWLRTKIKSRCDNDNDENSLLNSKVAYFLCDSFFFVQFVPKIEKCFVLQAHSTEFTIIVAETK